MSYEPKTYRKDGGDTFVVASGGTIDVESGGSFKLAGTAVTSTAAELNILDTVTATAAELNYLDASVNGAVTRYSKAPLTIVAATTAQDTTIVIPAGSIIKNVWIDVATQEATGATKTVDIGVKGGDEDGFLDGVSVAAAGTIKGTLLNTGQTLGAHLSVDESGAGVLVPEPYVCAAETTLCYTLGSDNFAELVANVIVEWVYIP